MSVVASEAKPTMAEQEAGNGTPVVKLVVERWNRAIADSGAETWMMHNSRRGNPVKVIAEPLI